jgi:tRNA/rRNA methyltransferase
LSGEDKSNFALRVVLVSPRNPLNIGAAARAMSNFGVRDLRLVRPYDVAFREARSAVNAHYILEEAEVCSDLADALRGCKLVVGTTAVRNRDLHIPLYRLETAGPLIRQAEGPVALLFGSEKFGLSNEDLSFCRWALRIPTREEHGSMNLGQAVAICLYELQARQGARESAFPAAAIASAEHYERFTALLAEVLESSGYINERTSESTVLKLRRLVRRLQIPEGDAETWLGILRQIRWKVRS